jgi:hypothetical protein
MQDTVPAAQVADLIAAIREALTAPDPAPSEPYARYEALIATRASWVRGVLAASARGNLGDVAYTALALREASRHVPARYEVAGEGDAS